MPDSVRYVVPSFPNPYPEHRVAITSFRYDSALLIMRLKDAVKMRESGAEDAQYILAADFKVSWLEDGTQKSLSVPRGMLTDLTSVPPMFRWLINRVGPWLEAVIVHDFLCIAWMTLDGDGSQARRRFADEMARAAMKTAKVGIRRHVIYAAVRAFALWGYPRRVDPQAQHRLYIDLDAPFVRRQLPPGVQL